MRILSSLAIFAMSIQAWQVILYEDTDNCNPKPNSKVRWLRNTADDCFTLGGDLELTKCTHYNWNGQRLEEGDGCVGNYWPKSAGFKDIDAVGKVCYFWTEEKCTGKYVQGDPNGGRCSHNIAGDDRIKSFQCKIP